MRRILILVLVACLTLPAEAALAAADPVSSSFTAEVERPPRKKKVKQRTSEWMRMYGKVGLRRHQVTDVEYTSSEGPAPDRTATINVAFAGEGTPRSTPRPPTAAAKIGIVPRDGNFGIAFLQPR